MSESQKPVWETELGFPKIVQWELDGLQSKAHHAGASSSDPGTSPRPKTLALDETTWEPRISAKSIEEHLLDQDLFGLALSGGGIRSSTFALGVIQRLAQLQLISRLHYLSTVSGGGYLGSWLAAWIQRNCSVKDVEKALIPPPELHAPPQEAEQVTWLRKYGKYLAPETSLFSADTWLIVALWIRNTTLNLGVFLLFLAAALMIPWVIVEEYAITTNNYNAQVIAYVLHWVFLSVASGLAIWGGSGKFKRKCPAIIGFVSAFTLCFSSLMLAMTHRMDDPSGWFSAIYIVIPLICMAFMMDRDRIGFTHLVFRLLAAAAINAAIVWGAFKLFAQFAMVPEWLLPILLPGAISAGLCLMLTVVIGMAGPHVPDERREWWSRVAAWMCIIGLVWFLLPGLALIGPSIFDFIKQSIALSIATGGLWAAATGAGIFLGKSSSSSGKGQDNTSQIKEIILPMLPIVFVLGLLVLMSAGLSHIVLNRQEIVRIDAPYCDACKREKVDVPYKQVWAEGWKAFNEDVDASYEKAKLFHPFAPPQSVASTALWMKGFRPPFLLLLYLLGYGLLSRLIDINEFSMHRFYRNRLARGFQGAANDGTKDKDGTRNRKADAFTNLDPNDDIPITHLQPEPHRNPLNPTELLPGYDGPIQLVNTAININLADTGLEERRASSFVFTPYACGYSVGSDEVGHYQRYPDDCDLRLGTPVTASGAAASPNMGYHTSGPVAFLLTVFNVRLGLWMFNTKAAKRSFSRLFLPETKELAGVATAAESPLKEGRFRKWFYDKLRASVAWEPQGPKIGTMYFVSELFGMASDDRKYVYLSDGGHFENMAVYELLRRRCRFIICVDGEQDEDMKFEGLAGLIRRARADLGCEIRIDTSGIEQRSKEEGWSKSHCAVGTIHYKERAYLVNDDETPKRQHNGDPIEDLSYLLYIKLSVTGDEPTDIINYRKMNADFPHQSTGDQFFNESQFESYRRLGWHAADRAMRSVDSYFQTEGEVDFRGAFQKLSDAWYGVPRKISENFSKHTDTLNELLDELRTEDALSRLNPQLNRHGLWNDTTAVPMETQDKACFYFCQKLIQFMETVFFDLDLESNYNHPSCKGWLERFTDWSESVTIQQTYTETKHTYSNQFQSFFERLSTGKL